MLYAKTCDPALYSSKFGKRKTAGIRARGTARYRSSFWGGPWVRTPRQHRPLCRLVGAGAPSHFGDKARERLAQRFGSRSGSRFGSNIGSRIGSRIGSELWLESQNRNRAISKHGPKLWFKLSIVAQARSRLDHSRFKHRLELWLKLWFK